jgi:hypothetical protein
MRVWPVADRTERVARSIATALGYEGSAWPDFTLHARAALDEVVRMQEESLAEAERPGMIILRPVAVAALPVPPYPHQSKI